MELKEFLGAYVHLRFDQKCQTKRHGSHVHQYHCAGASEALHI